ncbi:hypothetical protein B0J11DRAFT_541680 [Dendryphion nanum]|uniref:Uncharacterized protein n=1 Tax=Dendryphion nanum TaxID=256645 RepID=A0A9P9IB75_9PLEO|nr:hypothetical protein B0J11DRAFT_541680 [Dendryphion nanum]
MREMVGQKNIGLVCVASGCVGILKIIFLDGDFALTFVPALSLSYHVYVMIATHTIPTIKISFDP